MQNIDFISFGTFGSPNGFNQTSSNNLTYRSFDLNPNAIKLFPNSILYSIRKEDTNGINSLAYSIYTFAKERNSDRSGTFIGSSFIFNSEIPSEIQIINGLNNFHQNIIQNEKNVKGNVIQVSSSNDLEQFEPININELINNQKVIKNLNYSKSNKHFAIYIEEYDNNLISLLENSIELLNEYDTIFFTKSKEIAKYIQEKNLIELTNNDGFYKKIEFYREKKTEERKQKLEHGIRLLENTLINLKSDFDLLIGRLDLKINKYKNKTQDFEKSINSIKKYLSESYNEKEEAHKQFKKLKERLESEINNLKNGNINNFNANSLNEKIKSEFEKIKSLESNYKSESPVQPQSSGASLPKVPKQPQIEKSQKNENPWIIIVSLLLFISLLMNGFIYYEKSELETKIENSSVSNEENDYNTTNEPNQTLEVVKQENEDIWNEPNSSLNTNDLKKINKKFSKNESITIDSVVEIIFKLNPTDVKKHYNQSKLQYQNLLFEKNPGSFKQSGNSTFWTDELKYVPIFTIK